MRASLLLITPALAFTDYSQKCTVDEPCAQIESLAPSDISEADDYVIYSTSQSGDRLLKSKKKMDDTSNGGWQEIRVDPSFKFQTMVGFGGALTDAAAININTLTEQLQEDLLAGYYKEGGIEYTLGRVPIASCDFSTGVYSYCEKEEDLELATFSIAVDSTEQTGNKVRGNEERSDVRNAATTVYCIALQLATDGRRGLSEVTAVYIPSFFL